MMKQKERLVAVNPYNTVTQMLSKKETRSECRTRGGTTLMRRPRGPVKRGVSGAANQPANGTGKPRKTAKINRKNQ